MVVFRGAEEERDGVSWGEVIVGLEMTLMNGISGIE